MFKPKTFTQSQNLRNRENMCYSSYSILVKSEEETVNVLCVIKLINDIFILM